MMYGSWDMEHDWQNLLLFWTIFCPFTLPGSQKNQNLEKMKKSLEISSFYTNIPKIMIICYTVLEIQCMTDVIIIFYFGLFFVLLPPTSQKIKIFKKWKKHQEISSFYTCTKNTDQMMYGSWNMVREGWMDRQTEKVTCRGRCPPNKI